MACPFTQNFYMPGVARGMSSNRFGIFFVRLEPLLPSFPSSPSHLKLVTNRIGSLESLMVSYGSSGFLRVP